MHLNQQFRLLAAAVSFRRAIAAASLLFLAVPLVPAPEERPSGAGRAALSFDGLDDFVEFERSPATRLGSFTLETWFNRHGAGRATAFGADGTELVPLVSRGAARRADADAELNYILGIRAKDGVLAAGFQGASGSDIHLAAGRTRIREGEWNHAAAAYDGSRLRLFLNGRLEADLLVDRPVRSRGEEAVALATTMTPGGARAGFFSGMLREVRVWNGARTAEQVARVKDQDIDAAPGLVARWGLREGAGGLAADSTGRHPSRLIFGARWVDGSMSGAAAGATTSAEIEGGLPCVPTPSPLTVVVGAGSVMKYQANTASDQQILIDLGSPMKYLSNSSDPGIALGWVQPGFDDTSWGGGNYGVGYETAPPGAVNLLQTTVPAGAFSVFTRTTFQVTDADLIHGLLLGVDYDDGVVAWINGAEVFRSAQMPAGDPAWNTNAASHESSNGTVPNFAPLQDITAAAAPHLVAGDNLLAIGVWNSGAPASTDLVLVPRLSATIDWTADGFDDGAWSAGTYGVGYETALPGAINLLETIVPSGSFSVFTRARFDVGSALGVTQLMLGADYDDGYVAWINGVEVFRSAEMPAGEPVWNTNAALHESSNGTAPNFGTLLDISTTGIPALRDGENVLSVGVWNSGAPASTDLVIVPQLSMASTLDLCDGLDNDCDSQFDEDHPVTPTTCGVGVCSGNQGAIICLNGAPVDTCNPIDGASQDSVLAEYDSVMKYQANTTPVDMAWTAEGFNDGSWSTGAYGAGYETQPPGAQNLLQTLVPSGTASVFTRATFNIPDATAVGGMFLGADYDDGVVAWINGVEVFGSPEMPAGPLSGTTPAQLHESSNGLVPNYGPLRDISARAIPVLHDGVNVLAIGAWNSESASTSTDLVLVPRLSAGEPDVCDGLDNDCDGLVDEGSTQSDSDGVADCVDPDDDNDGISDALDCHPLNGAVAAAPPAEVGGMRWARNEVRTQVLIWPGQGSGVSYDLASGLVADLGPAGGVGGATCLTNDLTAVTYEDVRPDPAAGQAYYYIVRAQKDGCGTGSYGLATSGAPRLPLVDCP